MTSCSAARQALIESDYDLILINTPLLDETGEQLAIDFSRLTSQVMLIVKNAIFDEVTAKTEDFGIITVAKPLVKPVFWATMQLAKAMHNKFIRHRQETKKLKQQIDDLKIIGKAKCLLIEHKKLTELDAHKFIERHAMDNRMSKREVALDIIDKYE